VLGSPPEPACAAQPSSPTRSYLVFRDRDRDDGPPRAIVFRRTAAGGAHVGTRCDWCHRSRGRGDVQLLSARVTARRTIAQYLCGDLSCFRIDGEEGSPFEPPDGAVRRVERALERMYALVPKLV
jgi:treble-clef zinc-finger protein